VLVTAAQGGKRRVGEGLFYECPFWVGYLVAQFIAPS
jgi:hypothetical protein